MREYIDQLVGTAEQILRENQRLQKEVNQLTEHFLVYEKRLLMDSKTNRPLYKDSHTSYQPPSWDHFKKAPRTQSQRERSGKKPGGQAGHPGHTLNPVANPQIISTHSLNQCPDCHYSLRACMKSQRSVA